MESTLFQHAAANGLRLIETMGWDGRAILRMELHLDRLQRGAGMLGYPCDALRVQRALAQAAQGPAARLRLTLDAQGQLEVTRSPLPAAKVVWRVGLAAHRLDSADPFLRVKSTHRPAYDAARAALAPDWDEALLLNERGEVADGTITSVFFDRGEGPRTPPLRSGALPGVLRAALAYPEEILRAEDLKNVSLWVGNSLRGIIPVEFVG